jgi:hypothetical protein
MERASLGLNPELRTPQLPATHVEAQTGHSALARVLHPRHQPNLHGASHLHSCTLMPHPAIGGFQHHLRALTPQSDLPRQLKRIIVDPHRRTEPLHIRSHPHDHATTPMQV